MVQFPAETAGIKLNIFIADEVMHASPVALMLLNYIYLPEYKDDLIIEEFRHQYKPDEGDNRMADKMKEMQRLLKSIPKQRQHTKEYLFHKGSFQKLVRLAKDVLKADKEEFLSSHSLLEVVPFRKEKVLKLFPMDRGPEEKENVYIEDISYSMTMKETYLCVDEVIENLFNYKVLHAKTKGTPDFIKIPLWEFPFLIGLNYEQLKYTRDNLTTALVPFKEQLSELSGKLNSIPYSKESIGQIEQLYKDSVTPTVGSVQQHIDESLYLCKSKSLLPNKIRLSYCLGIASSKTLIDYYEKTKIVLPYVANEIRERVERHNDLNISHIFTYFNVCN